MNTNKKGFAPIVIIAVIAIVLVATSGIYYLKEKIKSPQKIAVTRKIFQNETADWKTYIDDKYGYEFKYPKNLEISANPSNSNINITSLDSGWIFNISVSLNQDYVSLTEALNQSIKKYSENSNRDIMTNNFIISDVLIGNIPAKKFINTKTDDYGDAGAVVIFKGNIINIIGDSRNNFDVFLNTFKFTSITQPTAVDEADSWKIYTNEVRKFEIKYPADLSVREIYTHNVIVCFDNQSDPFAVCIDDEIGLPRTNDPALFKEFQLNTLEKKLNTAIIVDTYNGVYFIHVNNITIHGSNKSLLQKMLFTLKILGYNPGISK